MAAIKLSEWRLQRGPVSRGLVETQLRLSAEREALSDAERLFRVIPRLFRGLAGIASVAHDAIEDGVGLQLLRHVVLREWLLLDRLRQLQDVHLRARVRARARPTAFAARLFSDFVDENQSQRLIDLPPDSDVFFELGRRLVAGILHFWALIFIINFCILILKYFKHSNSIIKTIT